jgi:hypothetical protein
VTEFYNDALAPLAAAGVGVASPTWAALPDFSVAGGPDLSAFYGWRFGKNAEQNLCYLIQLHHGHVHGSHIEPHIHWVAGDAGTGDVVFRATYSWAGIGEPFTAPVTQDIVVPAPGVLGVHLYNDFQPVRHESDTISDIILVSIGRVGNRGDGADDYDDYIWMMAADWHEEIDALGSRKEYEK